MCQAAARADHPRAGTEGEIEYVIIRPFNFIGPEMDYIVESPADGVPRVFPSFMSALLCDRPMYLVNGGGKRRTLTYIDDAIGATMLILENMHSLRNQIVSIGSPQNEVSMRELAQLMSELYEDITGKPANAPAVDTPADSFYGEGYEDCDRRIPDMSKLAGLGWRPECDLERTLLESMWYYCAPDAAVRQFRFRSPRQDSEVAACDREERRATRVCRF